MLTELILHRILSRPNQAATKKFIVSHDSDRIKPTLPPGKKNNVPEKKHPQCYVNLIIFTADQRYIKNILGSHCVYQDDYWSLRVDNIILREHKDFLHLCLEIV